MEDIIKVGLKYCVRSGLDLYNQRWISVADISKQDNGPCFSIKGSNVGVS